MTRVAVCAIAIAAIAIACSKAEPREAKPGAASPEAAPVKPAPTDAPDAPSAAAAAATKTADAGKAVPAKHPGTIVFVESDGTEKLRPATEVPESIAWATVAGKKVAVVRVVKHEGGGRIEIVSYGADGQVLGRVLGHR